jgi:hypothetical protein
MFRILIILGLVLTVKTFAIGAWYRDTLEITKEAKDSFSPQFVLLKLGAFSQQGQLSLSGPSTEKNIKSHCSKGIESIAWVTHRLSSGEKLSEASGKTLGTQVSQVLKGSCFSAVEIDIEPLTQAESWLEPFLKAVKDSLTPQLKLRLAVPVLSPKTIPGNFWSLSDGVKAISWVDGLDVMAYDSGSKTSKEYEEVFKNTFFFVMELIKQSPGTNIIVGLPAYPDKTQLHSKETENLSLVLAVLKPFTPFQLKPFCQGEIRLAYYSGWTLSARDKEIHKQIEEWRNAVCKKPL